MHSEIVADPNPIAGIWGEDAESLGARVGHNGVTKINAYEEYGEMAAVVWFRVWRGDVVWKRIRGGSVAEVEYAAKGDSDAEA